ncbi:hypothetical protein EJD97_002955 [Solanum chilense]|uniref:Uncharacterized protein n=1 Tax=Solanum chilense TaxID=4083 RepID=A0A6N2BX05_SOLCI|nr:hypothetical protein EJD97_002955 [Solanum chilense]
MNTRKNAAQIFEEDVANVGDVTHGDQYPPLKENANVDQAPAKPPPMTKVEMRDILAQMSQVMMSQPNREIALRAHQKVLLLRV